MSLIAFFLIVTSAGLHASWNMIAKKSHVTYPFYASLCTISACLWLHTQFWTPIRIPDLPWAFWQALTISVLADALLYTLGLIFSYRHLEMATAYPVMRSLPIIFTAAVTSLLGWGTSLKPVTVFGFIIVCIGALLMPLNRFSDFRLSRYFNWNMLFVVCTALGTTGYTIFDSRALHALRTAAPDISSPVRSITYYSLRGIILSTMLWIFVAVSKKNRADFAEMRRSHKFLPMIAAGLCASGTYVLVLMAMNYVTNVSYVQVFRQLGLPIGMLLGILILKERSTLTKWIGVSLILTGLAVSVIR